MGHGQEARSRRVPDTGRRDRYPRRVGLSQRFTRGQAVGGLATAQVCSAFIVEQSGRRTDTDGGRRMPFPAIHRSGTEGGGLGSHSQTSGNHGIARTASAGGAFPPVEAFPGRTARTKPERTAMNKQLTTDPAAIAAWVDRHRRSLSGRGLWLQGGEPNTLDPAEFGPARLRVLIVRLSEYGEVAAGLTHSLLFQLAVGVDGVYADLAFLPSARDESLMRRDGIPLLVGTGSKQPAGAFDVLAVSNSVGQELVNLPALLAHSGIPLSRKERAAGRFPFVLLGGSNSYVTSVLHGPVGPVESGGGEGLVDGVVVGDGEGAFPRFLELARDLARKSRSELLAAARREVPGFYDPAAYRQEFDAAGRLTRIVAAPGAPLPVRAHRADPGAAGSYFVQGPIFYHEESAGTAPLLVTSGCPYFCSFCKESWEQKPYRERPVAPLLEAARQMKANLGLSEIGLMTFNLNTCSGLRPLLVGLDALFDRVALKSQRFDAIARSPDLLERQLAAGKRTYTCAMEGISDRLRERLQKNLPESVLLKGFQELFQRNVRQMKIFLIITGWEEEGDLQEFGRLLERLKKMLEGLRGKPLLTFSLAALFRPPRTPLRGMARPGGFAHLDRLFQRVLGAVRQAGFEGRVSAGPVEAAVSEWLAYADRRGTARLVQASVARGFRYRGECGADLAAFLTTESPTPIGPEGYANRAWAGSVPDGSGLPSDGGRDGPRQGEGEHGRKASKIAIRPEEKAARVDDLGGLAVAGRRPRQFSCLENGKAKGGAVAAVPGGDRGDVVVPPEVGGWSDAPARLSSEERPRLLPYPWDDVDVGVGAEFLTRNLTILEGGGSLPSCLARPFGGGACLGCGACRTARERDTTLKWAPVEALVAGGSQPRKALAGSHRSNSSSRVEAPPRRWRVEAIVPRRWADAGNAFLGAVLARMLMRGLPGMVDAFLRVDRSMPRQGSYGLFWADILVKADGPWPPKTGRALAPAISGVFPLRDDQKEGMVIQQMRLLPGPEKGAAGQPGCRLRLEMAGGGADPAPRVDACLRKYRWTHQKKWIGDRLAWILNPGHAKKSGLVSLEWLRGGNTLDLEVLRWPDAHIFPALSDGDGLCEVVAFTGGEGNPWPLQARSGGLAHGV